MTIHVLAIAVAVFILFFVFELIRRNRLTFKYAFVWLVASLTAVFFAIFDKCLFRLSSLLGFELPSNFIFFAVSCAFIVLSLLLTVFLCQQNSRNDRMAQKIALLENEINALKQRQK